MSVCEIHCDLPAGHPDQVTIRPLTAAEEQQRQRDREEGEAARIAEAWIALRLTRDELLRATDHLVAERSWARWRQQLRDLPATTQDPETPQWPSPPAAVSCLIPFRHLWEGLDWTPCSKGSS